MVSPSLSIYEGQSLDLALLLAMAILSNVRKIGARQRRGKERRGPYTSQCRTESVFSIFLILTKKA